MYFTISINFVLEIIIWKIPARKITAKSASGLPPKVASAEAVTIAAGPVGPDKSGWLQPKTPTQKHSITAPHKPLAAPTPMATPKANACGSAITAPKTPPVKSPNIFIFFMIKKFAVLFFHSIMQLYQKLMEKKHG